jgi:hypothetical protein
MERVLAELVNMPNIPSTAETFLTDLAKSQPGDTLVLTGVFGPQKIQGLVNRSFNLKAATIGGWVFSDSSNLTFTYGLVNVGLGFVTCQNIVLDKVQFIGTGADALAFQRSTQISVTNSVFKGWDHALLFDRCKDGKAEGNEFTHFSSDAIDFANCSGITIRKNVIHAPDTASGAHPDGVQSYAAVGTPNTDILIEDNLIIGQIQGIFLKTNQDPNGTYLRTTIRNNVIYGGGRAITLGNGRVGEISGNKIYTLTQSPIIANVYMDASVDVKHFGNVVGDAPRINKKGWSD